MKRFIVSVVVVIMLTAFSAYAEDNTGKFSIGYHGIISGDFIQGLSSRYWASDNLGFEGNLYYAGIGIEDDDDDWDAHLFAFTGKVLYAPVVKNNSKFYLGLEAGYGKASADDVDEDLDIVVVSPLIGAEYFFSEIPEIGFDWEVGYRYNIYSVDDVDVSLHGISAAIGMHYYF